MMLMSSLEDARCHVIYNMLFASASARVQYLLHTVLLANTCHAATRHEMPWRCRSATRRCYAPREFFFRVMRRVPGFAMSQSVYIAEYR